ncbi:MAG TPA: LacI family DNA-binding transcriptional regulator [Rectinemataceae bacterium]|nr:LacI family DNA-binding transcriptional regulator [Rectinemataceae bacterium]
MDSKPKLDDVAALAKVSLSTASLALSDQGRLSAETRERVLEAAQSLGYRRRQRRPQAAAADTRDIVMLFDIDPEWAMVLHLVRPIIQEFERTLRQQGFNTLLLPISRSESTYEILEKIRCTQAIGVATIHFAPPELIVMLESAGIPVVVIMNSNFQDRFYTVCVDDFQGAYEGTSYLVKCGHLRIGYVDCLRPDLPVLPVDRFFGFMKAIGEYHLEFDDSMRRRISLEDDDMTSQLIDDLIRAHPDISAVFALDDDVAVRVVSMLRRLGIDVPGRISVLSPGDMLDYSLCYVPQITTMRIDTTYMGRIAGQMLHNRIAHNPQELHVLKVKQQLVKRGSVREITNS